MGKSLFVLAFLFLACCSASALEFSENEMNSLIQATANGYSIKILERKGQTLVLVGDDGSVNEERSKSAASLGSSFSLVAVEGTPVEDALRKELGFLYDPASIFKEENPLEVGPIQYARQFAQDKNPGFVQLESYDPLPQKLDDYVSSYVQRRLVCKIGLGFAASILTAKCLNLKALERQLTTLGLFSGTAYGYLKLAEEGDPESLEARMVAERDSLLVGQISGLVGHPSDNLKQEEPHSTKAILVLLSLHRLDAIFRGLVGKGFSEWKLNIKAIPHGDQWL